MHTLCIYAHPKSNISYLQSKKRYVFDAENLTQSIDLIGKKKMC